MTIVDGVREGDYGWFFFFLYKQKTAYEMRISDGSSDVCSSDLQAMRRQDALYQHHAFLRDRLADPVLRAEQHLVVRGARGDHRVAVLFLHDHAVEHHGARRLDHLHDLVVELAGLVAADADGVERLYRKSVV